MTDVEAGSRAELVAKVVGLAYAGERFVFTRGPLNPDVGLLAVLLSGYVSVDGLLRGDPLAVGVALPSLAYWLLWFDRHVAVFVPPYDQHEAADKLNRVIGGD